MVHGHASLIATVTSLDCPTSCVDMDDSWLQSLSLTSGYGTLPCTLCPRQRAQPVDRLFVPSSARTKLDAGGRLL